MQGLTEVLLAIAAAALLVFYLTWKWKNRHLEKLAANLPGPPTIPLLGNGLDFLGNPEGILQKLVSYSMSYDSPCRAWMGPLLFVGIFDPKDLQIVLNSSKALGKDPVYRFFRNTVGQGLFSAPVDKWKKHRRMIMPAFNTKLFEAFMPVFNRQNRTLCEKLNAKVGKEQFDIYEFIEPLNLDIICETALGVDLGSQNNPRSEFAVALSRASELDYMRIYKFWLHPDFIFNRVSYAQELKKAYKQIHGLPEQVIQKRKEEYRKMKEEMNGNVNSDEGRNLKNFLELLLELLYNGAALTDIDLRDEVVTMMIGGSETSALTNSFCCLMLAMHQDVQEKAYEEVYRIFGDSDREIIMEDVNNLVYLEQVIKETLRRFPVGPVFLRQIKEDLPISNHILPAGCSVVIAPLALHMREDIYPDPQKFDPDRFTPENVASRHKYSFIPFSGGPRGCIGSKYGMISMKITLATILRNYRLYSDCKMEDIKLKIHVLLQSVDGFPLRLEPRRSEVKSEIHPFLVPDKNS